MRRIFEGKASMKKIISLVMCLVIVCLSLSAYGFAEPAKNGSVVKNLSIMQVKLSKFTAKDELSIVKVYSDLKISPYKTYLTKLNYLGVMGGYSKTAMKPEQTVTVGEFIVWVIRALGEKPAFGKVYAPDPYIALAKKYGIIGSTEFKDYKKPIQKMQACKMLVKAMGLWDDTKLDPKDGKIYYGDTFKESMETVDGERQLRRDQISNEMKDYTGKALAFGLVGFNEKTGKFEPTINITKGMAAKYILKMIDKKSRTLFDLTTGFVVKVPSQIKILKDYGIKGDKAVEKNIGPIEGYDPTEYYGVNAIALPNTKDLLNFFKVLNTCRGVDGTAASLYAYPTTYGTYDCKYSAGLSKRDYILMGDYYLAMHIDTAYLQKEITLVGYDMSVASKLYPNFVKPFEYLFGKDAPKALAELKKILKGRGEAPGGYKKKFTLNGRTNDINQSGDSSFSWKISLK